MKEKRIIIVLDGSRTEEVSIGIIDGNKYHKGYKRRENGSSQLMLSLLETLLAKHRKRLTDVQEINVSVGPGSYTGLRVACVIGQMLGTLLGVLVNGREANSPLLLQYDAGATSRW